MTDLAVSDPSLVRCHLITPAVGVFESFRSGWPESSGHTFSPMLDLKTEDQLLVSKGRVEYDVIFTFLDAT